MTPFAVLERSECKKKSPLPNPPCLGVGTFNLEILWSLVHESHWRGKWGSGKELLRSPRSIRVRGRWNTDSTWRTVMGVQVLRLFEELCASLGQKSCRTKVSRMFRSFGPNFAPHFPRIFRGLFVLRVVETERRKKHQKSQANSKKKSTKSFWRAGNVTLLVVPHTASSA